MRPQGLAALATALLTMVVACDRASPDGEAPEQALARHVPGVDSAALAAYPVSTLDRIEQGRELYVVCAVCHGFEGEGTYLGPSLRGPDWIHITGDVEEIEAIVRDGISRPAAYPVPMPVMGGGAFDEAELRSLATYVHALGAGAR